MNCKKMDDMVLDKIDSEKVWEVVENNIIIDFKESFPRLIIRKLKAFLIDIKAIISGRRKKGLKLVKKWNEDRYRRESYCGSCIDKDKYIKWNFLIWQEICEWLHISKQVEPKDFKWIVERRGFDYDMANYLLELVKCCDLGRNLENIKLLSRAIIYIPEEEKEEKL